MGNNFLFTIAYKEFGLWDVKRYSKSIINSYYAVRFLGQHIINENKKVTLSDFPDKMFDILGISNDVGMFDAYSEKGNKFNQPYKVVNNGFIAYNPYRVNVGSIGIKTSVLKGDLISPAYVVFSCKESLLPEYLYILMKTDWFNEQVKENTSGSVRQNLTFDALSRIKIPIPCIEEQKEIISNNKKIQDAILQKEKEIQYFRKDIELLLFRYLGIRNKQKQMHNGFVSICNFSDLLCWGVEKNLNKINEYFQMDKPSFSFASQKQYLTDAFRGKSPIYREGTNSVILNQKCNRWDEIDIKFAKTVDENWLAAVPSELLLSEDDIIVNSTGEGTIGRASLVNTNFAGYLVDSHMLVLRLNKDYISPAFIVKQINSSFGQKQIELLKGAQATKQTELGIDNLLKMKFVIPIDEQGIPSVSKQNEIVHEISNIEDRIKQLKKEVESLSTQARQDFEKSIFT